MTTEHYEVELRYHLDSSSPAFIFLISLAGIINHHGRHGIKGRLPTDRKMDLLKMIAVKMQVSDWSKVQLHIYCITMCLNKTKQNNPKTNPSYSVNLNGIFTDLELAFLLSLELIRE